MVELFDVVIDNISKEVIIDATKLLTAKVIFMMEIYLTLLKSDINKQLYH